LIQSTHSLKHRDNAEENTRNESILTRHTRFSYLGDAQRSRSPARAASRASGAPRSVRPPEMLRKIMTVCHDGLYNSASTRGKSAMPSFDIVSEVNKVELKNAVDQSNKEIANRFDFKGSDARIEQAELVLTLYADDDFKLKQVTDVLLTKCAKRAVDARMFDTKSVEKIGTKVKQPIHVKAGIEQEKAKSIVKLLKDSKMKVQANIQGSAVRVSGAKRDDLQAAIALVRKSITDIPLQFQNFRD
jgi:uncharacterized protein YajQ (UPF0234 family)